MTGFQEFFLFSVFFATGASLDCETCIAFSDICTGPKKACAAKQDTCAIILSEIKVGGIAVPTVMKGCESSHFCEISKPIYATFGKNEFFQSAASCCTENACDSMSPKLPEISTTTNGRKCPACYCLNNDSCPCTQLVDCIGSEEHCFDLVEEKKIGEGTMTIHVKGCATESFCIGMRNTTVDVERIGLLFVNPKCKQAGNASTLPTSHLLALSGVLLMRFLL